MISRQRQTATKRACPPSGRIIAFHQQIHVADTLPFQGTTDEGVIFFFLFPFRVFSVSCSQNSHLFPKGRYREPFLSTFFLFCFGCQLCFERGGVYTHEDRWMWRWYNSLPPPSLTMSHALPFPLSLLSVFPPLLSLSLFLLIITAE